MKLPQFSLRTIFVLIAIISIPTAWSAYQLHWIRQRHQYIADDCQSHDLLLFGEKGTAPWSLRLFGEETPSSIYVARERAWWALTLFPEMRADTRSLPARPDETEWQNVLIRIVRVRPTDYWLPIA